MLSSVEHEILNAHKYKKIKKFGLYLAQISLECYFSRSTIVGILTFMSRKNFMLSWAWKNFYNLGASSPFWNTTMVKSKTSNAVSKRPWLGQHATTWFVTSHCRSCTAPRSVLSEFRKSYTIFETCSHLSTEKEWERKSCQSGTRHVIKCPTWLSGAMNIFQRVRALWPAICKLTTDERKELRDD